MNIGQIYEAEAASQFGCNRAYPPGTIIGSL